MRSLLKVTNFEFFSLPEKCCRIINHLKLEKNKTVYNDTISVLNQKSIQLDYT